MGNEEWASFELTFRPNLRLVSTVRRFVSDFYERILGDSEVSSRMALATHELLENAAKYSENGETQVVMRASLTSKTPEVALVISNRATAERVSALKDIFAELDRTSDAMEHYLTLMRRNAKRSGSGLGLARIRAESAMELRLEAIGGLVSIHATLRKENAS